jgi:hypothetical protein
LNGPNFSVGDLPSLIRTGFGNLFAKNWLTDGFFISELKI